jgi:hypothetical protein
VADAIHDLLEARVAFGSQANGPAAVEVTRENFRLQHEAFAAKHHLRTRVELVAGMDQRVPAPVRIERSQKEAFDGAAAGHARADQPGRKHFGVVDDQQIAGDEPIRQP